MVFPPSAVAAALPSPRGLARLTLVALGAAVGSAFVAIYTPPGTDASGPWKGAFVCDAARDWRAKYGADDQLRVIETYVSFRGTPGQYHVGEGVVVAPVAASLPGAQEVLDVRGDPAPSRRFDEGGMHALGWEYPGTLHRDLAYVGLALVRRPSPKPVALSEAPTFATLGSPWSGDARLTAADLEEHGLDRCKAFVPWVQDAAGDPPYTAQILRIVERLSAMRRSIAGKRDEDVCAGLRSEPNVLVHRRPPSWVRFARQRNACSRARRTPLDSSRCTKAKTPRPKPGAALASRRVAIDLELRAA